MECEQSPFLPSEAGRPFFVGIDPGKTGAVAFLNRNGNLVELCDFSNTANIKFAFDRYRPIEKVVLEKVGAMPGQGVVSMFNFGTVFGWWLGLLDSLSIPYEMASPRKWQKMYDMKKEKGVEKPSLYVARSMFPAAKLDLKKDHNRADALLIAYYGYKEWINEKEGN